MQNPRSAEVESINSTAARQLAWAGRLCWRYRKFVFAFAILFSGAAGAYCFFVLPKEYTVDFVIMPRIKGGGAESLISKIAGVSAGALAANLNMEVIQLEQLLSSEMLYTRVKKIIQEQFAPRKVKISRLNVKVSAQVFKLAARSNDPQVAFQIANAYLEELQNYLNESSTMQAKKNAEFIQERIEEAKKDLDRVEDSLMKLKMGGRGLGDRSLESESARAQREFLVRAKVLESLSQQYELAQIDSKKEDLNFMMIDPPVLPEKPSGPRLKSYILFGLFLGVFSAMVLILGLQKSGRLHWLDF